MHGKESNSLLQDANKNIKYVLSIDFDLGLIHFFKQFCVGRLKSKLILNIN